MTLIDDATAAEIKATADALPPSMNVVRRDTYSWLETRAALIAALERLVEAPGYESAIENYNASQHARRVLRAMRGE